MILKANEQASDARLPSGVVPPDQGTPTVIIGYTNWRGEYAEREIVPLFPWFGATEWHPEPQWLLKAWDSIRDAERDFAIKDIGRQQRRASVASPDQKWVKNLAARISVDVCEIERDSPEDDPMACVVYAPEIDAIVVRRATEALAALSVVSHETGDGDRGSELRQIISDAHENTMARPAGRRGPFNIPDAITDETQGVKRELGAMHTALQRWRDEDHEDTTALTREQVIEIIEEHRSALSQLEAVEQEKREYAEALKQAGRTIQRNITRAETAEASLAAMREALTKCERRFDNIRGAIESNQVVDKDVHGTAIRGRDEASAALAAGENR